MKIWPSGTGDVNVAGAEVFDAVAKEEKLEPTNYGLVFGGDAKAGQVAAVAVDPETTGATPVRHNPKRKTLTIYLNELFDETPELRPTGAKNCSFDVKPDGGGGTYILIHLNQGLPKRTTRRQPETVPPVQTVQAEN